MPGAKGNRTKGNVKPSSSSRAAELLSQSGSTPTGFVGFGGVSGAAAYVPASQALDDVDSCLDSDFRLVMRKLTKRDATTKIKALGEFSVLCREKDDSTLQAVLPFWPRLYSKLAIDCDAKVREGTQTAMGSLVGRVRRQLAPYLRSVMGAWVLARNDTYPTVASAAHKAFSAAFPPDKQENAIVFCKQSVLEYMTDNLLNQTASTLSDPKTTEKEEMESKLLRVQCSSLMGLRQLLLTLPTAQLDDDLRGQLRGLLADAKFWNLAKSPQPLVRSGVFWFLGGLSQVLPDVATEFLRKISPLVLGSVDVLEPALIGAVWSAVLSLVKFVPECWENINWPKAFWPKLRKLFESGCQGNAVNVAPNFLPLLSCVPMETAGGASAFFPKVMEHLKLGFAQDSMATSPAECNAWSKAFVECLQLSFRLIGTDDTASPAVLQALLLDQLVPVVEASLFDSKPTLSRSQLLPLTAAFLRALESKAETSPQAAAFWSQVSQDVCAMFDSVGSGGVQSLRPDRLALFVKALLYPRDAPTPGSSGGGKKERVRFSTAAEQQPSVKSPARVPAAEEVALVVEISEGTKSFVKDVVVRSHKLYQQDRSPLHLKLFVDLANLYFPADIATFMLESLDGQEEEEEEGEGGGGEGTGGGAKKAAAAAAATWADPHSGVIERVVLPVLGGKEEGGGGGGGGETVGGGGEEEGNRGEEVVEHTITLLFACLPYLSERSGTEVWDSVLQTVKSTGALCSLLERALEKRGAMRHVSQWLGSPRLHARLCSLVATVTSQHSTLQPRQLEQGWRLICLVLSANDDYEPVFPARWVLDIVGSVHQELLTLASRPLDAHHAQRVVQFVARAALTFFQNLKMSLCLSEGRDVIVALMMADLDSSFPASGEAGSVLREAWTTGLGRAVRETGGLIQDGGMLTSACGVLTDTLLSKTQTLTQYKRVMNVAEALLRTVRDNLPRERDDEEDEDEEREESNPVLLALLSQLLIPPSSSFSASKQIVQYLCLTAQLPLTALHFVTDQPEEDHSAALTTLIFSCLFNVRLLGYRRSHFRLDGGDATSMEAECGGDRWEGEEDVLLEAARSLLVAETWIKVQSQVCGDVVNAVEELTRNTHTCFSSAGKAVQQGIMNKAFARVNEDVLSALTVGHLAQWLSTMGSSGPTGFHQLFSEKVDSVESGAEILVPYLPLWKTLEVFRLQAAVLTSVTAGTLDAASSCLRVMGACLRKEAVGIVSEHHDLLMTSLENLKKMRDEHSTLFLFSCDIKEEPLWRITFNASAMNFLTTVVRAQDCPLTPELWDFVLCSAVSWLESVDNSRASLRGETSVETFCVAACGLVAAVAHTVQQRLPLSPDAFPPNLQTEWGEFFAEGLFSFLFPLFVSMLDELRDSQQLEKKKQKKRGRGGEVVVGAVGWALSQCPQERVLAHNLPARLQASDQGSPLPDSLHTLLNHLCPALTCPLPSAQLAAHALLDRVITLVPSYHKEAEQGEGASEAETELRVPPAMLMKVIEDCATAMDVVLSPVDMGCTVAMAPGSEEFQFALGYLLAWHLMLRLFHSAGAKGRAEYATYLKEQSSVSRLLTHLFRLMPASRSSSASPLKSPKSPSAASPLKPASLDAAAADSLFESSRIPLTAESVGQTEDIGRASCCVYLHCLEVIPVLVRQWWKDQDRKSAAYVDKFTTKHVSPQLIKSEMQSVNSSESAIADLAVKANSVTRQVTATYTTDELKAEIQVTLPESYPLGEITVDAQRHAVVKQAQWERMLLQLTIFLQHQNGTIMEGLRLWKRNIDKRIEGVEECFICYAVIHASNYELPMVPCKTCKKKFHKACLYKWLNSSQNSTCPLCRSIF